MGTGPWPQPPTEAEQLQALMATANGERRAVSFSVLLPHCVLSRRLYSSALPLRGRALAGCSTQVHVGGHLALFIDWPSASTSMFPCTLCAREAAGQHEYPQKNSTLNMLH